MKTKYIIALSVLLVAGYFGYRTYQYRTDPLIAGIPPQENADGTVDYTLRTIPAASGIVGQRTDILWVVRLPKSAYVDDFWHDAPSKVSVANGPTISFGAARKNSRLKFYFDPAKKELATSLTKEERFWYTELAETPIPPDYSRHTWEVVFAPESCKKIPSPFPNMEYFISVDDATFAKIQAKTPNIYQLRCARSSVNPAEPIFALFDDKRELIAHGECNTRDCYARVMLPNLRAITVQFPANAIGQLAKYRGIYIEFLQEHTIQLDRYFGQPILSN